MIPEPLFVQARSAPGRTWGVGGMPTIILAHAAETGGTLALTELVVPPGAGPPPHVHTREDETFYVLEGEVVFTLRAVRHVAPEGTMLFAPRNVAHVFRNESSRQARLLVALSPPGFERYFEEVGSPLPPGATTAPPPTAEDIARLIAAAPAFGLSFVASA